MSEASRIVGLSVSIEKFERASERAVDMSAYYGQAAFIRQKRTFKGGDEIVNSISWKEPYNPAIPSPFSSIFSPGGFCEPTLYFHMSVTILVVMHLLPGNDELASEATEVGMRIALVNNTTLSNTSNNHHRIVMKVTIAKIS